MRIGIVVEGPTDVCAVVRFVRQSLQDYGISSSFVDLQPPMDNTSPEGGWAAVLRWLEDNPAEARAQRYFGGGLFDGELFAKVCDVIVVQMDADILGEKTFVQYSSQHLGLCPTNPDEPKERGREIRKIIEKAGSFSDLSEHDRKRHIAAPAVESTETWCVAAFRRVVENPETLRGQALVTEFMTALHVFESRRVQEFAKVDKTQSRRDDFCGAHAVGAQRLAEQCFHYRELVKTLVQLHGELYGESANGVGC